MKRVVVTGLGIVSSIGNNSTEVIDSLKEGRSGLSFSQVYADLGFRSHVHGAINIDCIRAGIQAECLAGRNRCAGEGDRIGVGQVDAACSCR